MRQAPADEGCGNSEPQSDHLTLLSRSSVFLSGALDSFSVLLFCLPFSSLSQLLSSWCSRFLPGE
jgi:hypothetical protein